MDMILQAIRPLNQDERTRAYKAAQNALATWIGVAPTREQFANHASSKYPRWIMVMLYALCVVMLLAAFTPSAIRLYDIGSKTFAHSISDMQSANLVGVATILLAEIGQIIFLLALNVLGEHASRQAKALLIVSALASTAVALAGNLQTVEPWNAGLVFAWIEAITPPLLVLATAYVLKEQMLDSIAQRHASNEAYKNAMQTYQLQTSNLEKHERWQQFYSNAIFDQLRRANKSKAAKEAFKQITPVQKLALYQRELQADGWFMQAVDLHEQEQVLKIEQDAMREQQKAERLASLQAKALQSGGGGGNHTGEVDKAKLVISNGLHVAHCPHCKYTTPAKDSELKAKRALSAHLRAHKNVVVLFPKPDEEDTEPVGVSA